MLCFQHNQIKEANEAKMTHEMTFQNFIYHYHYFNIICNVYQINKHVLMNCIIIFLMHYFPFLLRIMLRKKWMTSLHHQ